jgi:hypothetical protein
MRAKPPGISSWTAFTLIAKLCSDSDVPSTADDDFMLRDPEILELAEPKLPGSSLDVKLSVDDESKLAEVTLALKARLYSEI